MESYIPGVDLRQAVSDRRLCPYLAGFQHMPPTIIVSAGLDRLRHENKLALDEFIRAGVDSVWIHYNGVPHGYMTFHFLQESKRAFDDVSRALKRNLPE